MDLVEIGRLDQGWYMGWVGMWGPHVEPQLEPDLYLKRFRIPEHATVTGRTIHGEW